MVVGGSCVVWQFRLLQLLFIRGGAAMVLSWLTVDSNVVQEFVEGLYVIQVCFRFGSALVEHCVD